MVPPVVPPLACGGPPRGRTRRLRRALLTPGPPQPDPSSSADSSEDGRGGALVAPGVLRPGRRVAVRELGDKAEGGTFGLGTVRQPERYVGDRAPGAGAREGQPGRDC